MGQQQNAPENMCAEVGRTPRSSLMSLAVLPPATRHSSLGHFPGQQPVLSPAVGGPEQAGEGGRRASLGDASLLGPRLAPHLASPWPSCSGGRRGCSPASPPVLPLETAPPPPGVLPRGTAEVVTQLCSSHCNHQVQRGFERRLWGATCCLRVRPNHRVGARTERPPGTPWCGHRPGFCARGAASPAGGA